MKNTSRTAGVDYARLRELSALELVELLEREEALVEQFEQGRREGAEALIDALCRRIEADASNGLPETANDDRIRSRLRILIEQMNGRQPRRRFRNVA